MYNLLVITCDMRIKFGLMICLLFAGVLRAQEPVTIECRIGEGIGKTIQLFGVENGQKKDAGECFLCPKRLLWF